MRLKKSEHSVLNLREPMKPIDVKMRRRVDGPEGLRI